MKTFKNQELESMPTPEENRSFLRSLCIFLRSESREDPFLLVAYGTIVNFYKSITN